MLKKLLLSSVVCAVLGLSAGAQEPTHPASNTPLGTGAGASQQAVIQNRNPYLSSASLQRGGVRMPTTPRQQAAIIPGPTTQGLSRFNVKNFGAVCDGATDDTTAVQNAYNAAAQALAKSGGAGIVYFPPSSGPCVVDTIHVPNMTYGEGWLISEFENGLNIMDTLYPGNNSAFIGVTSTGLNSVFQLAPNAVWQKPKWATSQKAVVTLTNVDQVYFQGISIFNSYIFPAVLEQDQNGLGVVNIKWERCSIFGDYNVIPSSPHFDVGFGLKFEDVSLDGLLNIQNLGDVTFREGYLQRVALSNVGAPSMSDFEFDDVLSEGLEQDFLTVDTTGGEVVDITLHRVKVADAASGYPVYMAKHVNNTGINWNVNIKFDQIPEGNTGNGLIDPTSAPELFSVVCIGANCEGILNEAKSTLYMLMAMPPKNPLILYGSQYVPNPLEIVH